MSTPGLDPRFFTAPSLQMYFVDKDTGFPLTAGVVKFWADQARTIPKNVYILSGTPPAFSYTSIGASVKLTGVGTFSDNNNPANDVLPYYFPYDGTPDTTTNTLELYFIDVYDQNGVLQFSREGWPNVATSSGPVADIGIINYIPNGQFLAHNNVVNTLNPNVITQPVTYIAQGGWTFERPSGSSATDLVEFVPILSPIGSGSNPTGNPKFRVNIINEVPASGDAFKYLKINFPNVNKFASTTETYTFAFTGVSDSSNLPINIYLIKNFGSGGSSTTTTLITSSKVIPTSEEIIQTSFTFGTNVGKTVGPNNDDTVSIAIGFPTGTAFNVLLTDFLLTPGTTDVQQFPTQTDYDMYSRGVAGAMPFPDPAGSDLYLPLIYTPKGVTFDTSVIGNVYAAAYQALPISHLYCDGTSYPVNGYSTDLIPYSRLYNKIGIQWGTGYQFVSAGITDSSGNLMIVTNQSGATSNISAGTSGLTVATLGTGNTAYAINAYLYNTDGGNFLLLVQDTVQGLVTPATAGTVAGATVTQLVNNPQSYQAFTVNLAALPGINQYITFHTASGGNYYLWFKVNGVGTDPAPGGTGIPINLLSDWTQGQACSAMVGTLNGGQTSYIVTAAGSSIIAGSYIVFFTSAAQYVLWFQVDSAGTQPVVVGTTLYIKVNINSTDTQLQVGTRIVVAINTAYFGVPDLRDQFLRGWSYVSQTFNTGSFPRFSNFPFPSFLYQNVGSYQLDNFQNHLHGITYTDTGTKGIHTVALPDGIDQLLPGGPPSSRFSSPLPIATDYVLNGSAETRPVNALVSFIIKY